MAFNIDDGDDKIDVIISKDEAVTCDREEYAEYLKTHDESHLKLNPELQPTRFVLKKTLTYAEQQKIKNSQVGFKDGDMKILLSYILDEVRFALVDIKGPGKGIEFKKDSDGYAAKSLIEKLDSHGVVRELYEARQAAIGLKSVSKKS